MNKKLTIILICTALFCACVPAAERTDVSGEIIHVQESTGWAYGPHTVIRDANGFAIRVNGVYGKVGDKVKIKGALIIEH